MAKRVKARNLHDELKADIVKCKIKLLAHSSDNPEFGIEECKTLSQEYLPKIMQLQPAEKRLYLRSDLHQFEQWCEKQRVSIIDKHKENYNG